MHVLLHAEEVELRRRIAESDEHPGNPAASEETRKWRYSQLAAYGKPSVGSLPTPTSSAQDQVIQAVFAIITSVC